MERYTHLAHCEHYPRRTCGQPSFSFEANAINDICRDLTPRSPDCGDSKWPISSPLRYRIRQVPFDMAVNRCCRNIVVSWSCDGSQYDLFVDMACEVSRLELKSFRVEWTQTFGSTLKP